MRLHIIQATKSDATLFKLPLGPEISMPGRDWDSAFVVLDDGRRKLVSAISLGSLMTCKRL